MPHNVLLWLVKRARFQSRTNPAWDAEGRPPPFLPPRAYKSGEPEHAPQCFHGRVIRSSIFADLKRLRLDQSGWTGLNYALAGGKQANYPRLQV